MGIKKAAKVKKCLRQMVGKLREATRIPRATGSLPAPKLAVVSGPALDSVLTPNARFPLPLPALCYSVRELTLEYHEKQYLKYREHSQRWRSS